MGEHECVLAIFKGNLSHLPARIFWPEIGLEGDHQSIKYRSTNQSWSEKIKPAILRSTNHECYPQSPSPSFYSSSSSLRKPGNPRSHAKSNQWKPDIISLMQNPFWPKNLIPTFPQPPQKYFNGSRMQQASLN